MRETSTQGPSLEPFDDDTTDAVRAGPFVAAGLILLLPMVLFALGAVVVDLVAAATAVVDAADVGVDAFAALVLSCLFGLALRSLPPSLGGATGPVAR